MTYMTQDQQTTTAVLYRPIFFASLGFTFLAFGLPIYNESTPLSPICRRQPKGGG
ncbi:MAG: hypothetical protein GY803_30840 [Chloroflexi bacterium]|nr:hypothetical protein [Chloroflexota bacterium]